MENNGAILKPVGYGYRACTNMEKHFYSFVSEADGGRWGIKKINITHGEYIFIECVIAKD